MSHLSLAAITGLVTHQLHAGAEQASAAVVLSGCVCVSASSTKARRHLCYCDHTCDVCVRLLHCACMHRSKRACPHGSDCIIETRQLQHQAQPEGPAGAPTSKPGARAAVASLAPLLPSLLVFRGQADLRMRTRRKFELMDACLLYTSPSPRDQRGSRMPSSA